MPAPSTSVAAAAQSLALLATDARSLRAFRSETLALLKQLVPFDGAVFHALSPRVPLATGVFVGITQADVARSLPHWDDLAVELGTLRELASRHWVASDTQAFAPGSRARARFDKHITRPFKMRSLCMMHLMVRGALHAAVVLMARRRDAFSASAVTQLRKLAPIIAAGDTLQVSLDQVEQRQQPLRLVCRDQRLTVRQREIAELVALGHTNEAIGEALEISPNTVRNHLAKMFTRLGAATRTELVRLVVLSSA